MQKSRDAPDCCLRKRSEFTSLTCPLRSFWLYLQLSMNDELTDTVRMAHIVADELPFDPNQSQYALIHALSAFVLGHESRDLFLIDGYAGTGKTSVMGALVRGLKRVGIKTVLLAPTGRAAKVFSSFAGSAAHTIHKRLFRGNGLDPTSKEFHIAPNKDINTIFIVDEASMISDSPSGGRRLLDILISHIYSSSGCAAIFMGDTAQLPPVGQSDSPAMNRDRLRSLGVNPIRYALTKPVRQAAESGILFNAGIVRAAGLAGSAEPPRLVASPFPDVEVVSSRDLEDYIVSSWGKVGKEETIIITRSNRRAYQYNMAVRTQVLYCEEELERGDWLIVAKNNYYWAAGDKEIDFIANGDIVRVDWTGHNFERHGLRFAEAELTFPSKSNPVTATIVLDSLGCDGPTLPIEKMNRVYTEVTAAAEGTLTQRLRAAMTDPCLNALQVKYAYCITCHKAQGGQWSHVYIDLGGISREAIGPDFFRWLYTAITRATGKVFLVNPSFPVD